MKKIEVIFADQNTDKVTAIIKQDGKQLGGTMKNKCVLLSCMNILLACGQIHAADYTKQVAEIISKEKMEREFPVDLQLTVAGLLFNGYMVNAANWAAIYDFTCALMREIGQSLVAIREKVINFPFQQFSPEAGSKAA
jgi:hypothetical protein